MLYGEAGFLELDLDFTAVFGDHAAVTIESGFGKLCDGFSLFMEWIQLSLVEGAGIARLLHRRVTNTPPFRVDPSRVGFLMCKSPM